MPGPFVTAIAVPAVKGLADIITGIFSSNSASNASRDAARLQHQASMAALADAREERSYDRMTAEEQRKYDRMTSEEQRAYDRARYADETGYERGRYAEERDYGRSFAEDERDYGRNVYAEERDHGRGQFANYLQRLAPYSKAGAGAVNKLGASVGQNTASMVPTMGGGRMVRIQAPNGQVKEVPSQHADHYVSRGGILVG